jgi:hypothetical protein
MAWWWWDADGDDGDCYGGDAGDGLACFLVQLWLVLPSPAMDMEVCELLLIHIVQEARQNTIFWW